MAMLVSTALLFTSVDGMTVHAEELADMVPPVAEEENPGNSENPDASGEGGDTQEEPSYAKNEDGAVIITSFVKLTDEVAHIELEEREELKEVIKRMPVEIKANVEEYVDDLVPDGQPGEGEGQPGEGEGQPGEGEDQPGEGEGQPGEGEDQPGEGEGQPGEGEGQPGEGEG